MTELKNATLLVVDDHAENLDILIAHLDKFGFTIMVAQNGEEAIELALEFVPDIILLDVMMPGIDGFETCRRLKNHHTTQPIPIIFMTALSETIDKVTGFEAGGVDYITKPFQAEEVLVRVETHLQLKELNDLLKHQNEILEQKVQERTRQLSLLNQSLARFVPHEFLHFLDKESILDVNLGDHVSTEMAVLFSDIRSFSPHTRSPGNVRLSW